MDTPLLTFVFWVAGLNFCEHRWGYCFSSLKHTFFWRSRDMFLTVSTCFCDFFIWVFPKMVPQNGWFIMENPIKMDNLWVKNPIFETTHIFSQPTCESCVLPGFAQAVHPTSTLWVPKKLWLALPLEYMRITMSDQLPDVFNNWPISLDTLESSWCLQMLTEWLGNEVNQLVYRIQGGSVIWEYIIE